MQIIVKTDDSGAQVWHLQLTEYDIAMVAAMMSTAVMRQNAPMFSVAYNMAPTREERTALINKGLDILKRQKPEPIHYGIDMLRQILLEQTRLSTTFGQA